MYIDTEGSFMEERAKDIASAFVGHVHKMGAQTERNERDEHTSNLSVCVPALFYLVLSTLLPESPLILVQSCLATAAGLCTNFET